MANTNKIAQAIQARLNNANGQPITLKMKLTGLPVILTKTKDGITASGPKSALRFSGKNIIETAEKIADYENIHNKWVRDEKNCRELFEWLLEENPKTEPEYAWENFCYYAEQHERVFGFRPAYLKYGVPEQNA